MRCLTSNKRLNKPNKNGGGEMQLVVKVGGWLGLILIEQWATGVCLTGLQAKSESAMMFLLGSGSIVLVGLVVGLVIFVVRLGGNRLIIGDKFYVRAEWLWVVWW